MIPQIMAAGAAVTKPLQANLSSREGAAVVVLMPSLYSASTGWTQGQGDGQKVEGRIKQESREGNTKEARYGTHGEMGR